MSATARVPARAGPGTECGAWYHCAMAGWEPVAVSDDIEPPARSWHRRRMALLALYVTAFVVTTASWGFPASRDRVLIWVVAGLVIAVVGRPHALARLAVDFLPVIVFLYAYDLLRGAADGVFGHVYEIPQLRVDEWLAGGTAPTVRLQRAALDGGPSARVGLLRLPRVPDVLHRADHGGGGALAPGAAPVPPLCQLVDRPVVRRAGDLRALSGVAPLAREPSRPAPSRRSASRRTWPATWVST